MRVACCVGRSLACALGGLSCSFVWVFVPCLTIAVSVAVSVTYLLFALWSDDATEEHCGDDVSCRDLLIEFVVAHYGPLVGYLVTYVLEDALLGNTRRGIGGRRATVADPIVVVSEGGGTRETVAASASDGGGFLDERARYCVAAFQLTLLPTLTYASVMVPDSVYGSGANTGGVAWYVATAFLFTLVVSYPLAETAV